MTPWYRVVERVTRAWVRLLLELTDLVWGLGDLPDMRPAIPTAVDREYFELIDREGRP
jgi:hypothetical protein